MKMRDIIDTASHGAIVKNGMQFCDSLAREESHRRFPISAGLPGQRDSPTMV